MCYFELNESVAAQTVYIKELILAEVQHMVWSIPEVASLCFRRAKHPVCHERSLLYLMPIKVHHFNLY